MTNLSEMQVDTAILEARAMRAAFMRKTLTGWAQRALGGLHRIQQRRRTLAALSALDDRVLADIGLTRGSLRRAAYAAADQAYDQEQREAGRPAARTPIQALNATLFGGVADNSNSDDRKAA